MGGGGGGGGRPGRDRGRGAGTGGGGGAVYGAWVHLQEWQHIIFTVPFVQSHPTPSLLL